MYSRYNNKFPMKLPQNSPRKRRDKALFLLHLKFVSEKKKQNGSKYVTEDLKYKKTLCELFKKLVYFVNYIIPLTFAD